MKNDNPFSSWGKTPNPLAGEIVTPFLFRSMIAIAILGFALILIDGFLNFT